jgi:hypothetical protein
MLVSPNPTVKMLDYAAIVEEFGFEIYGSLDKKQDGTIGSELPCWYMDKHQEEEERLVGNEEVQLQRGGVHPSQRFEVEQRVRAERQRLDAIKESKPVLDARQVDMVAKVYRELSTAISRAMPTRKDLASGFSDIAHEEAVRIDTPCVPVTKETQRFIILCNGAVSFEGDGTNGKVSRLHAEKAWKFAGKLIGDSKGTNTEALRKAK